MTYEIQIFLKVSEKKWIESLKNGHVCFNPVEIFIKKAEQEDNNEQGDKYEGIFARLNKNDRKIHELKKRLGDDLEIISDQDHVLLRRKSARNVPVFCTYGARKDELNLIENSVHIEKGEYVGTAIYDFPEKIYNNFLSTNDVWGFYASAGHFTDKLENALERENIQYKKSVVNYDVDLTSEFCFELDDEYSELNHKRKDLEYQHECRYRLLNFPRNEKYIVQYDPLSERSCGIAPGAMQMEIKCICDILED